MSPASERQKAMVARRKERGVCVTCGKERDGITLACTKCREYNKLATQKKVSRRIELGLCRCGREKTGVRAVCEHCAAHMDNRKKAAYETGMCRQGCKSPRLELSQVCRICWFKKAANQYLGDYTRFEELIEVFDSQEGQCAYTKRTLMPGYNASVDHVIPKSRGGTDTLENLHFVELSVNYAKRNLLAGEFKLLCAQVLGLSLYKITSFKLSEGFQCT